MEHQKKDGDIDQEFLESKLKYYVEVQGHELKIGDHFRYTSSIYQQFDRRKCIYAVVKEKKDNILIVSGYNSSYDNWVIDPNNKFKKFRFYVKK